MSFESVQNAADAERSLETGYRFDFEVYANENFERIGRLLRSKGHGHFWDFFDPEDLANVVLAKLWKYVSKHPDSCLEKISIDKIVSTIVVRTWVDEVRRERQNRNLNGSGTFRVSLSCMLSVQVADGHTAFDIGLWELLDHIKAELSDRQQQVLAMRLEGRDISEIALLLSSSESTIDKDIASIKNGVLSVLSSVGI